MRYHFELAWLRLRLAYVRALLALGCVVSGTSVAEVRRLRRLQKLAGRG